MRALVTGARGFVGHWLSTHLQACGDDVVTIDHEVDVTDAFAVAAALRDADAQAVYHLAAFTHVGESWKDPDRVMQVNVLGTLHVLEAARAQPTPPVVLLTSSAEVYGAVAESLLPVTELAPLAPVTPYAASKVAAEYLGVQQFLAHGLRVVRVRPFNHVGPGQAPGFVVASLASRIVEAHRRGSPSLAVGNLRASRDFTDVRDVVRAYRLLVEKGTPGEVYNVCSGRDVVVEEIARTLLRLAGTSLELVSDPELTRPVDVPVVRGDPAKLQAATGWVPEIDLDQTLSDVLEQWSSLAD
ncbi:MAG TPA: GDP-mannose 4,6-dehydratase [Acidimicrobiales bacterium]|nr:GDP-mannose 4,6-dehydratase [Acidimicrobiales bacterium]